MRGGGLELMKPAREPASSRSKPCASLKNSHESCLFAAPPCRPSQEEKRPWSHISFSLRNLPGRTLDSRAQGFSNPLSHRQSSCPFTESGAYPPNRVLPDSPRQCSLPLACRNTSRRVPNWSSEEARTWEHHPQPTIPPPRLNRQVESRRKLVDCISRG